MSSDLLVVATFGSQVEAELAKGVLDEVGIESMIRADTAGGMYPSIGATQLLVRAEDVTRAEEALNRRPQQSS